MDGHKPKPVSTLQELLYDLVMMQAKTCVTEVKCECGKVHRVRLDGFHICECGKKVKSPILDDLIDTLNR